MFKFKGIQFARAWVGRIQPATIVSIGLLASAVIVALPQVAAAQTNPTPLPISIPSRTPTPPSLFSPTPSRTPTLIGSAIVEAKDKTTGANVRPSPNLDSDPLGKIFPGQFFPIIGKYGQWYQILYGKPNPDTTAWVYEGVVNVTGPVNAIPTVQFGAIPTANILTAAPKLTADHLTQTPGAPASATALQLSATGVTVRDPAVGTSEPTVSGPKPTFTYPPPLAEATLAPRSTTVAQSGVPPVVPIIGLAAVGLFGLLISGLRRL